jgi:DNA-binding transcriptional MerR regulator
MRRITELKDIGFTLDEIKRYCDAVNDGEKNQIIKEKYWSLTKLAEDTADQLEKLEKIKRNLLQKGEKKMIIDANAPFENDERVIGRWEIIATVDKKEDFTPKNKYENETIYEELYFLPGGEEYWGFGWTKGYIKILFGDGLFVPYELCEVDGEIFMFADHPIYGGTWVLKQTDSERHTKSSIGQNDNIDLPFADDPQVHGEWASVDFVNNIEDFDPAKPNGYYLYIRGLNFLPDGEFEWQWKNKYKHRWTKGTGLVNFYGNTIAPAYEIRIIDGVEYLFFENKNGDYIWGKIKPRYYVFKRGAPEPEPAVHFHMPFENDETMVGHWEMVATVDKREDFIPGQTNDNDSIFKEIYFMPEGREYWVFSWTKGYIKHSNGNRLFPYTLEEINGERYIFAECKTDWGFRPIWVLRQTDNKSYTLYDIGQWDNINLPFADDPAVHGTWTAVDYVEEINMFNPGKRANDYILWLQAMEFFPDGRVHNKFRGQDSQKARWTKGTLLFSGNFGQGDVALAYIINKIGGEDYLFYEWKSGDCIWGKQKPAYYVLKRD